MRKLKKIGAIFIWTVLLFSITAQQDAKVNGALKYRLGKKITVDSGESSIFGIKGAAKVKSLNKKVISAKKIKGKKKNNTMIRVMGKKTGKTKLIVTVNGKKKKVRVTVVPKKVENVKATLQGTKTVELQWAKSKGAVKYEIWRSTDIKSGYKKLGTVKTNSYTDEKTKGKYYYYKVRALGNKKTKGKYSSAVGIKTYQLTWSDEFNGNSLDRTKWTDKTLAYSSVSENQGTYEVKDGNLVITPSFKRNAASGAVIADSLADVNLSTNGLKTFTYGRFEIVAKLPKGDGLVSAGWLMNERLIWPKGGEIDLFENKSGTNGIINQLLLNGKFNSFSGMGNTKHCETQVKNACDEFHTYAIEWNENSITYWIDGKQTYSYNLADFGKVSELKYNEDYWPFNKPFIVCLSSQFVQGISIKPDNWTKVATEGDVETYEDSMIIDAVRVYQ